MTPLVTNPSSPLVRPKDRRLVSSFCGAHPPKIVTGGVVLAVVDLPASGLQQMGFIQTRDG
jgi:hypothetical protein